jgi:glycerol-3-phosphate dehydrogenase
VYKDLSEEITNIESEKISLLEKKLFDVVVIGGGIAGLSITRELAKRGLDVALLEKDQLGAGASNNSLRIIHGGLRYLSRLNFPQMLESIRDQYFLLQEAPSLVKTLPCVMPLSKFGLQSKIPVYLAAKLYSFIVENYSGSTKIAQIITNQFIKNHIISVAKFCETDALLWFDARIRDPQKLHALLAHKIDRESGLILTRAKVQSISKDKSIYSVKFSFKGESHEVVSRVVVNATGPGFSQINLDSLKITPPQLNYKWAKAFNVILKDRLEERYAFSIPSSLGRQYFVVPRGLNSVIGTGYLPCDLNSDKFEISDELIDEFLLEPSKILNSPLERIGLDCGIIPVKEISKDGKKIKFLGRSIITDNKGFINVINTKYSGFYSLGMRVVKMALKHLS